MTTLWIAIAGAIGSACRHVLGSAVVRVTGMVDFPAGTFVVNAMGSFAIGVVMTVFALRGEFDSRMRIVLTTGLLGGFTTYSAFAYETVALIERDRWGTAVGYICVTTAVSTLGCVAGVALTRALGTS